MNPKQLSAQFAAYVWYLNQRGKRKTAAKEATRFAEENWSLFGSCAHEGLGRLLLGIAGVEDENGVESGAMGLRCLVLVGE